MKVYLSGPMTGYPELNYPAFMAAAEHLRALEGVEEVYNPAEWEKLNETEFDLQMAFEDYCKYIIWDAEYVFVLPGWQDSPGATAEVSLARALKKQVYAYSAETGWKSL